jgi:NDP-sugar pyrophosphorylase family protein
MILAAGLGTRLRPLTDRVPKALVTVGGTPMLERIAQALIAAGVDRLIVNVHHHADQVRRFIAEHEGFGVDVLVSEEQPAPLETGGGLQRATRLFRRDAPFLLHNVDVICDAPLAELYADHTRSDALASLAVGHRDSSRMLRFDDDGLQARVDRRTGRVEEARPRRGPAQDLAFAGVHAVSPEIFELMEEEGAFSIMVPYLRLAGAGHRIRPWDLGPALWLEVGDPDRLEAARRIMARTDGEGD